MSGNTFIAIEEEIVQQSIWQRLTTHPATMNSNAIIELECDDKKCSAITYMPVASRINDVFLKTRVIQLNVSATEHPKTYANFKAYYDSLTVFKSNNEIK